MAVTIKDVAAAAGVSPSTVSRTCKDNQYENANAAFLNQKENERGVYQLDK